ncbi:MAG: DUF4364 family protein [Clostridia bacterium]|nr:DUF4364 family protein [Clostridia bacterium]MEE1124739.1 DUF4364 family protein [Acutalibacteraceae bacterium]
MSFEILYNNSGIAPGGLRNSEQIKILLCFLMYQTNKPVTSDFICGVLQKCGAANYFEASQSFAELVEVGQIVSSNDEKGAFVLAESGKYIVLNLSDELPLALRENTLEAYKQVLHQCDIKQENTVTLHNKNNKTYVECTVNDGDNPLLKVNLYVPSTEQASLVRNTFYNNTDVIYQTIVALMTGDKKTALNTISVADFNKGDFI